jgi:hypothetical protein
VYPAGGYQTVSPAQLAAVVAPYLAGELTLRSVRVYLATLEMRAVRDAARRSRPKRAVTGVHFRPEEIRRLTGLSEAAVGRELRRLKRRGVLIFQPHSIDAPAPAPATDAASALAAVLAGKRSPSRPVPLPRVAIRFLAKCSRRSVALTLLAYLVRGLSLDRATGEVRGRGTIKLSWVGQVFALSERATKYARAELVRLGWIGRDQGSVQRKLNRDGAYFCLNLQWGRGADDETGPNVEPAGTRDSAPLVAESGGQFAPPNERQVNYSVDKNQKAAGVPGNPAGVSSKRVREPSLRDVSREDLEHFSRTEALYRQAVRSGMLADSEASFLNWVAAAVRAKTVAARDPVRVFMGIVRRGLWTHITGADEDRARSAINRYRASTMEPTSPSVTCGASSREAASPRVVATPSAGMPVRVAEIVPGAFLAPPPRGRTHPGAGWTGQGGTVGRRDPRSG